MGAAIQIAEGFGTEEGKLARAHSRF
jgi:hypothetical protein